MRLAWESSRLLGFGEGAGGYIDQVQISRSLPRSCSTLSKHLAGHCACYMVLVCGLQCVCVMIIGDTMLGLMLLFACLLYSTLFCCYIAHLPWICCRVHRLPVLCQFVIAPQSLSCCFVLPMTVALFKSLYCLGNPMGCCNE